MNKIPHINKNISKLLIIFLLLITYSCTKQTPKISFSGQAQGTYYNITYFDKANRNLQKQIDSILKNFNYTASMYEPQSILSKINDNDTNVELNEDFIAIFNLANEVSQATQGAFDISVGPLVNLWGFGLKNRDLVDTATIKELLQYVDYKNISIKNNKLIKLYPQTKIDFNAIAKGYSVDKLGLFLESKNINNYIIEIGGEIKASGKKADSNLWLVGIDKPNDNLGSAHDIKAKIKLSDMAIATSGNYRKFYIENGVKYSHTINPFTGYPVNHSLLSATVFHKNCATADAYATAFMVMGLEKTKLFLENKTDLQVYLIYSDLKGEMKTFMSNSLKDLIIENE